ncbi:MAG: hypothetical protein IKB38_07075 [Clostridia bacterium]|nr:hypothetical protein [Clostridia bacterium]
MKKRIISLLLAVVMLFSCLSLNVFATEENAVNGGAAEASVVSDTFTDHDSTDISAAINAAKIPNSPHSYSDGTSGISGGNNVSIKYENGKIVKIAGNNSQSRVELSGHTNLNGRYILQNYTASNVAIGKSFVLQATWEFTDAFVNKTESFFQISDYVATNFGAGYSGNPYCYTTDGVFPTLLSVNSSMQLTASVAGTNNSRTNVVIAQLSRNVEYTFSVFVNPSYVDEATDTYGTFDVYVNGELVEGGLKFCNKHMNDGNFTFDEKIPYANQDQWSNLGGKVLKDGATIYFFSETVPENVDEILANCGITCAGTYTAKATGRTKTGVKDYSLGFIRFQMSSTTYSDTPFYIDNLMCYYTDEFKGTFIEHELTSTHAHDFTKDTVEVVTTCALCDGKRVETAVIDANGDKVCDVCVGELPVGGLMTPTEIKESGINYVISTELDANSSWVDQVKGTANGNQNGSISLRETDDGNVYIAYGKPTIPDANGAYAQAGTLAGGRESALQNRATLAGQAYTIAFDMMHDGTINYPFLLDLYSYTAVAGTKDENGIYTTISQTNAINWQPIKMNSDGALYYRNGVTDSYVYTGVKIPTDEFHNIVFYHNPADNTFSLYYDGECVASDVQALPSTQIAASTWTATEAAMRARYGSYVQDSYFKDGYFTMNGAADFTLGFARFPQFNSHGAKAIDGTNVILSEDGKTVTEGENVFEIDGLKYAVSADGKTFFYPREYHETDYFALDNIKVYYTDECVECAHEYTLSHTHDLENGVNNVAYSCKFCDKVVEAKVAMSNVAAFDGSGKILSVSEIKDLLGEDVLYTNDLESGAHGFNGNYVNNGNILNLIKDNDNTYLSLGKGTDGAAKYQGYTQYNLMGSGTYNELRQYPAQHFDEIKGKAYVLSTDVCIPENSAIALNPESYGKLFVTMSYASGTNGCTTLATGVDVIRWNPILLGADGSLKYYNTATYVDSGFDLTVGEFHTVAIHHTPKGDANSPINTYDVYVDGVMRVENATALSSAEGAKLVYTSGDIVIGDKTYNITATGAQDYIPGAVQSMQPNVTTNFTSDIIYTDNYKAYYADSYTECAHKYTDSTACDWCGKTVELTHCDICDGKAISENAAVVGKSVSLGELIDMNIYVKYLGNTEGVYANLFAGNKEVSVALDELTADENGIYKFSIALNSIMMASDVTLTLDDGEYKTSVMEYAAELIEISDNDTEITLAKALLNYGAYAQVYFAEKNEDAFIAELLANSVLDEADKGLPELNVETLEQFAFSTKGAAQNVTFTAVSLTLSAKTYVNLYFTAPEGATVKVNGKTYTPADADGEYCVTLTVSTPDKVIDAFEVAVTDGEETVYAYVSAASAIYAALANNASSENLINLLAAYAAYAECAVAYVSLK